MDKRLLLLFAIIITIAYGTTTIFLIAGNADLRRENRAAKKRDKLYEKEIRQLTVHKDSLQAEITKRNELIEKSTVVYDSIQKKLIQLNDKKIVTNFPTHNTISTLDLDAQIELLARFIGAADSIGR